MKRTLKLTVLLFLYTICNYAQFITTWQTTAANETITIPTFSTETYNYTVDWGDGSIPTTEIGDATHAYATAGTYTVSITGTFPRIYFNRSGDRRKILTIEQWGNNPWTSFEGAFWGCNRINITNLNIDSPDLSNVTSMVAMFNSAYEFNGDVTKWNTTNVTDMGGMFKDAWVFNQDLSGWNTINVTNMQAMFESARAFNGNVSTWNTANVSNMINMFKRTWVFNQDISGWETTKVTDMSGTFNGALAFNQDIGGWNTSRVRNMSEMFRSTTVFNQDIGGWNTSMVTDMSHMFDAAKAFNQNIGSWNTGSVTDMDDMFRSTPEFNRDIGGWDVSNVTSMRRMFESARIFNQNIGAWNVSNVRYCTDMFNNAKLSTLNYDALLLGWSTRTLRSNVGFNGGNSTYCKGASAKAAIIANYSWGIKDSGEDCRVFTTTWETTTANESISIPTVLTETYNYTVDWGDGSTPTVETGDATHTYTNAGIYTVAISGIFPRIYFNNSGDKDKILTIEQWGIEPWSSMEGAFWGCSKLHITNHGIDTPNLTIITNMSKMFEDAIAFNADISSWDVSKVTAMDDMFKGVTLSSMNYYALLKGWSVLDLQDNVAFSAGNSTYCEALPYRTAIETNYSWMIQDGGLECKPFITTWETTTANETITIPTFSSEVYNYTVDWGDGSMPTLETGDATHTYSTAGTYTVSISGTFPRIYFDNGGDKTKIKTIEQWGSIAWSSMESAFYGCSLLNITNPSIDLPNLVDVTDMGEMFRGARAFNGDVSRWDVSWVTDMAFMFSLTPFNQDISSWNTSGVIVMVNMFSDNRVFNQDIGGWNTNSVINLNDMFRNASAFNQDISGWNTSKVFGMARMFNRATAFNQDIGAWDTSSVTDMRNMFDGASRFNQDIGNWQTGKVTNMSNMFASASAFNQDIGDWDVRKVILMNGMFRSNAAFNGDISGWITSSATKMWSMFSNTGAFNQDIGGWNTSKVDDMSGMFSGARVFNQDISTWDISNVDTMDNMFSNTRAFNQPIGSWDITGVSSMNFIFSGAEAFDQDLSGWTMSGVARMSNMFDGAQLSTENYDATLKGWSTQTLRPNVNFSAGNSTYCQAGTERQSIIDTFGWTITDGGVDPNCPPELSIDARDKALEIAVFPNPVAHTLHIAANFDNAKLYDIHGVLVATTDSKTLHLKGLSSGMYLLEVMANTAKTTVKVVKL